MEDALRCLGFKRPWMALAVLVLFGFGVYMVMHGEDHVQKFGWGVASGIAVAYLTYSLKALFSGFPRLAILMLGLGALLMGVAVDNTPKDVFAANALENFVGIVLGPVGGLLAKVENEPEDA